MTRGLIIKPDPDLDEYVVWSNIVESPLALGTAEQVVAWYGNQYQVSAYEVWLKIERANATGTSSLIGDGRFGDSMIFEQRGVIACSKLAELTRFLLDDDLDGACDLCDPFDDEPAVRRG